MSLWTFGNSGLQRGLAADSKGFFQHHHKGKFGLIPRPRRLLVQAVHPSENVRASLAIPSMSVDPTSSRKPEASLAQRGPSENRQSTFSDESTARQQHHGREREREQGATLSSSAEQRSGTDQKHTRRDAAGSAVPSQEQNPGPDTKPASNRWQRTSIGESVSTAASGNLSIDDRGAKAGHDVETDRKGSAASPDSNSVRYTEEKASRQQLLQHLQEARERSRQLQDSLKGSAARLSTAVRQSPVAELPTLHKQFDPGAFVDRKVYDQLRASRNRLSKQLSERNRDLLSMEQRLLEREQDLVAAAAALEKLRKEAEAAKQLAEMSAAAHTYGVDRAADRQNAALVVTRLNQLQNAFSKEMEYLDAKVPRKVPVAWFGVASEVRLMGSFDGWTRGVDLSADDISDSVFTRFEATVLLLPGEHEVKFLVDGNWRLAPHWPSVTNKLGDTNNVLAVM